MRSVFNRMGGMRRAMRAAMPQQQRRNFGASGGEPHVPEGYDMLGKVMLVSCYLWIFYRIKEDKGQLFGLYKPWEHEHEHTHMHFVQEGNNAPVPAEEDEEDEH